MRSERAINLAETPYEQRSAEHINDQMMIEAIEEKAIVGNLDQSIAE